MNDLVTMLTRHEGLRLKPYKDSVGKLTIGVGRNLDDVGISNDEARLLLTNDIIRTQADLDRLLPWWNNLDGIRRAVLTDMGFNMGVAGLCTFTQTLDAVQNGRYVEAADHMLHSKWAAQVGPRATELAAMMRTGQWPQEV